jgi:hypothetical protein
MIGEIPAGIQTQRLPSTSVRGHGRKLRRLAPALYADGVRAVCLASLSLQHFCATLPSPAPTPYSRRPSPALQINKSGPVKSLAPWFETRLHVSILHRACPRDRVPSYCCPLLCPTHPNGGCRVTEMVNVPLVLINHAPHYGSALRSGGIAPLLALNGGHWSASHPHSPKATGPCTYR